MVVYDLVKHHDIVTVQYDETVLDVAKRMNDANIGAVPVLRNGQLAGMFSERDVMRRVVVEGLDPAKTRIGNLISTQVVFVGPKESLEKCSRLMRDNNVRHLPICDGDKLIGLVSLRDILAFHLAEKEGELQYMRQYVAAGS